MFNLYDVIVSINHEKFGYFIKFHFHPKQLDGFLNAKEIDIMFL